MWERGLKHSSLCELQQRLFVAPHVGAWIETLLPEYQSSFTEVAPHVGAWIET